MGINGYKVANDRDAMLAATLKQDCIDDKKFPGYGECLKQADAVNHFDSGQAAKLKQDCIDAKDKKESDYNECLNQVEVIVGKELPGHLRDAAGFAFVPVLLGWGFLYLLLFLVRRNIRSLAAAKPQPQTTATPLPRARHQLWKRVSLGLAGLCVLGILGGGGYYAWTRYVKWRERTKTCREWEGKHPVGSPLDLDVGKLERQFVWDPPRGCSGPLEDAYRKQEIAWREEQQKNGVKDYAVELCRDLDPDTGSMSERFAHVECVDILYEPLPENSPAITGRYLEGASQQVRDCVAESTPAGNIAALLEQREHCTETPNNPVVLGFSKALPIQPGSELGPSLEQKEVGPTPGVDDLNKFSVRVEGPFPKPGMVSVNPKDGLKYVWIPPGTFMMGCSPGDNECTGDEKPAHRVMITKGFWMGQTEVTVAAYKRFAAATRRQMPPEPDYSGRPLNPGG